MGEEPVVKEVRLPRWYFGGIAGSLAACVTHPMDLLKVHLQVQDKSRPRSMIKMTMKVIDSDGYLGMYNGLTAAVARQMTYTVPRFAVYEFLRREMVEAGEAPTFGQKVFFGGASGFIGGLTGTPADMVNVRMQSDMCFPRSQRRNYLHFFDGIIKAYEEEGMKALFKGCVTTTTRGGLMNIGQLSFYEDSKAILIATGLFEDNMTAHFSASVMAGGIATFLTQPLDVVKTLMMDSEVGEYSSILHCVQVTSKGGIQAFFKGMVPSFLRLAPHTILLFVFFEQLRLHFGEVVVIK